MHFERLEAAIDSAIRSLPDPGAPDWKPLEAMLGPALIGQFMFMGTAENGNIVLYKHGMTRRYLNVGRDLRTFEYTPHAVGPGHYRPIPLALALLTVFENSEKLGALPDQKYDDEFKEKRDASLAAAGYRSVTGQTGTGVQT